MANSYMDNIFSPTIATFVSLRVLNRKGIISAQDLEPLIPVQPGSYAATRGLVSVSVDPTTMMVSNVMRIRWFLLF